MTDCRFQSNQFCAKLSSELREELCGMCSIKRYARHQCLMQSYWDGKMVLLLDGMMVCGQRDPETGKFLTTGMAHAGTLVSTDRLFEEGSIPKSISNRDIICMFDCAVASFESGRIKLLLERYPDLMRLAFSSCLTVCGHEKNAMVHAFSSSNVSDSVRYVVKYCRDHRLPQMTHEQIALISNHSRPTVTRSMQDLVKSEPELFRAEGT